MTTWEYMTIEWHTRCGDGGSLNRHGCEGWEMVGLVAVAPPMYDRMGGRTIAYFKRPVMVDPYRGVGQ